MTVVSGGPGKTGAVPRLGQETCAPRQANVARVLAGIEIRDLDARTQDGRGEHLAETGTADLVDAHFTHLVRPEDRVLTSDPDDIRRHLTARNVEASIIRM